MILVFEEKILVGFMILEKDFLLYMLIKIDMCHDLNQGLVVIGTSSPPWAGDYLLALP